MDLSQRVRAILSFVQVADAGSFAAAARMLGISAAAVSKNVARLEQALGVRLMNRTTRTLNLTNEGSAFLKQARIALEALDTAVDAVAAQRVETSGHVRISTSSAFGRDQLMPALPGLLTRYPGLSVEVDFDDRVIDLVHDGYDLAIRGGRIADSALIARPICRLNMVLVASPTYLERNGVPSTPKELSQHKLITRRFLGGRVSPWCFRAEDGSIITLDQNHAMLTLSAPEALVQAASFDMGIAQVGVHHAWKHLSSGTLKVLLLGQHDPGSYEMVMQYPHRALMAPRVRATIDYLLAVFAKDDALHVSQMALAAYVS
ncbi:LysR family transcriptional regulator [Prodigiosinella confusarubida]|uniref:LysR family transcriptional regulator n=1 Tax=Serratia sp. (strain ATCC 39006) TaxID=104623 RepID=A0A2I5TNV0_SERS3|nr:LysR family transcriptional regulator [Serratia sp. ATCC 39006]AUH01918.1 LysR family transcriptional regulator [Serratia sp. ATCC 39006]AUH06240.1 LysR family transcriptional regulator [Serratia sp. ATCC 39006]